MPSSSSRWTTALFCRASKIALERTVAAGGTVRADDNADALKTRLMAYYRETAPLLGYYFCPGASCAPSTAWLPLTMSPGQLDELRERQ